ncbi:hypothetical protein BOW32_11670 [Solemya velum gill symbiont]|nr:hypothetical protein BOW32_11670 [Solemya velum gill symbiont]OOZ69147.1 hypothetical protein BOW48_12275 [Solemya velum gill symbiont]
MAKKLDEVLELEGGEQKRASVLLCIQAVKWHMGSRRRQSELTENRWTLKEKSGRTSERKSGRRKKRQQKHRTKNQG